MAPDDAVTGVVRREAWRLSETMARPFSADLIEEVPAAFVYNGISHAVMLASPVDLDDFAVGFSLSEAIIEAPDELLDLAIVPTGGGVELRMRLTARRFAGLKDRRRTLTGASGCGLCGIESLAEALRPLPVLTASDRLSLRSIRRALEDLGPRQRLNRLAGAVHAAVWCDVEGNILHLAEDVGRHNAFDKMIGRLACRPDGRPSGFALVTSRLSYELVAKAATVGIASIVAISAPTSLAIAAAERAGICVVALARADCVSVYSRPDRVDDLTEVLACSPTA